MTVQLALLDIFHVKYHLLKFYTTGWCYSVLNNLYSSDIPQGGLEQLCILLFTTMCAELNQIVRKRQMMKNRYRRECSFRHVLSS